MIPDLECPKCGGAEVRIEYCDGCVLVPGYSSRATRANVCTDGDPEHFHRYCQRCRYAWRTDDIPDPKIHCAKVRP